jgi:nucleotide-binding universal stress UspA family protein/nitroimidazol reductase NimA-like FMN-containing flavoprotein (pyridoxamine 5'-phosphate oxidase superfamily)
MRTRSGDRAETLDRSTTAGPIVVGIDGEAASRRALRLAADHALRTGQSIRAVLARDYCIDPADEQAWQDTGEDLLRESVLAAAPEGMAPEVELLVVRGDPASGLLAAAADADVLVMGSRGVGGLPGALQGPVLPQVLAHAPCPVLVVRDDPAGDGDGASDLTETADGIPSGDGPGSPGWAEPATEEDARTGTALRALPAPECFRLLATQEVGRLATEAGDFPLVIPVNHGMDGTSVVIRMHPGTTLAAVLGANVSFEVDEIDRRTRSGWSVLVRGRAQVVSDEERDELVTRANALMPWAPGEHGTWVRIVVEHITGRRIVPGDLPPAVDPRAYL